MKKIRKRIKQRIKRKSNTLAVRGEITCHDDLLDLLNQAFARAFHAAIVILHC